MTGAAWLPPTDAGRQRLRVDPAPAWPTVLPIAAFGLHPQPAVPLAAWGESARVALGTVLDEEHGERWLR